MGLVDQIKKGWVSWVFQGVPAAGVVLTFLITITVWYGHVNDRLDALEKERENTVTQMETLTRMIDGQTNQIQELKDRLEDRGDISARKRRKPISFNPDSESSLSGSGYVPR